MTSYGTAQLRVSTGSLIRFVAILVISMISGCVSRPTGYDENERTITTRGGLLNVFENGVFHDVLYGPESIALTFPGLIVGLDKGRQHAVADGVIYPDPQPHESSGLRAVKQRMKQDPKAHYVSHIVSNNGQPFGEGNCVLYTIYTQWADEEASRSAGGAPNKQCPDRFSAVGRPASAYEDSWKALGVLRAEIERLFSHSARPYTHVVLVVMGWNTPQVEAVQNFNAIASQINAAAPSGTFVPLFVGITWPSIWSAKWLDPAIRMVSYVAKAHDADEVGVQWISQITDAFREVAPSDVSLVAIGHSFGARAVMSAVCGDSPWPKKSIASRKWDVVIGWKGAFSIHRFGKKEAGDGFAYPEACLDRANLIMLTASQHDSAVDSAFWADMVGSNKSWHEICQGRSAALLKEKVHCIKSDYISAKNLHQSVLFRARVNYVDASNIVYFLNPTPVAAHTVIFFGQFMVF
jgi:hypothetical protein